MTYAHISTWETFSHLSLECMDVPGTYYNYSFPHPHDIMTFLGLWIGQGHRQHFLKMNFSSRYILINSLPS